MNAADERIFKARLALLPDTAAFIEDFCARSGVGNREALRLMLLVEELFTNTVVHGYQGDCDAAIRVVLSLESGAVSLLYEDAAPRYDPLSRLTAATDQDATLGSRPIGGLGILLVTQIAGNARYAYEAGFNRLWLKLSLGG
jgi:serine/threonine-protein kinase RsbW